METMPCNQAYTSHLHYYHHIGQIISVKTENLHFTLVFQFSLSRREKCSSVVMIEM